MPIARHKPGAVQPTTLNLPRIEPATYAGVVEDGKYTNLKTLSQFAEGYPLTVTYYGQRVNKNNDVREIDPSQSGVYQQYYKVINLEIRVDDPLSLSNFDTDTGQSTITGSANIISDIRPNTFDYMTFGTAQGRTSLFRITEVTRKSPNRDSMFNVEYTMVGYIDQAGTAQDSYTSLDSKVNEIYYFDKSRIADGGSPLLKEQEAQFVADLGEHYQRIVDYYLLSFINHNYQTFIVPGQLNAIYDKFIVDFMLKIISVQEDHEIDTIKQLGTDRDPYMAQPQIWLALSERNPLYVLQANQKMGIIDRRVLSKNVYIGGAGLFGVDNFVYPILPDLSLKLNIDIPPFNATPGLNTTQYPNNSLVMSGTNMYTEAGVSTILYKGVLFDSYYVFSQDFYQTQSNWSVLEKVTWDYLNSNAVNMDELTALIQQYYTLNRLDQFYYGPVLLLLIKDARAAQYSS